MQTDKVSAQIQIINRELDLVNKNLFERELNKLKLLSDELKEETDQPTASIYEHRKLTEKVAKLKNECL